jgi:hypothetical protein
MVIWLAFNHLKYEFKMLFLFTYSLQITNVMLRLTPSL